MLWRETGESSKSIKHPSSCGGVCSGLGRSQQCSTWLACSRLWVPSLSSTVQAWSSTHHKKIVLRETRWRINSCCPLRRKKAKSIRVWFSKSRNDSEGERDSILSFTTRAVTFMCFTSRECNTEHEQSETWQTFPLLLSQALAGRSHSPHVPLLTHAHQQRWICESHRSLGIEWSMKHGQLLSRCWVNAWMRSWVRERLAVGEWMRETQASEHRLPNLRSIWEQCPFESPHASCRLGMEKHYPASISVPIKFLCLITWPRELVCRWTDLCYIFTTGAGGKITIPR